MPLPTGRALLGTAGAGRPAAAASHIAREVETWAPIAAGIPR